MRRHRRYDGKVRGYGDGDTAGVRLRNRSARTVRFPGEQIRMLMPA